MFWKTENCSKKTVVKQVLKLLFFGLKVFLRIFQDNLIDFWNSKGNWKTKYMDKLRNERKMQDKHPSCAPMQVAKRTWHACPSEESKA